ncbi:hypothetical protein H9Q74_008276 [Fusarium xylarioides]|nr:hypothetical protein H9Q71_009225 [Fusarium xylarioides]KAG5821392.1 hypothetical protein H9Q74_008276 [Fusarium xylarioides]
MSSISHLGQIKNSLVSTHHHQLPERERLAAPTPHPRNSEARQDYWDGRIPNVTRDVIVQIVDQLPHSIRYLQ